MLMVRIKHKDTKAVVTIPAAAFQDYCEEHHWSYPDTKVAFEHPHVHYSNCYLSLFEKEDLPIVELTPTKPKRTKKAKE